jgi:prepilin-type N-terminal cleavage/methylation domain-containing protein
MPAAARPAHPERQRGFTMLELITVLVIAGVLAVVALPKLQGAMSFQDDAWHDSLTAALRYAQKTAVARRRLVCADVAATSVTLTMAPAYGATSCSTGVPGPSGGATFATSNNSNSATAVSPGGTLYFQPNGRVTSDGAGTTAATRSITLSGATTITVNGETGYVE